MSPDFKIGQRVQVSQTYFKGCYAVIQSIEKDSVRVDVENQEGASGKDLILYFREMRVIPWQIAEPCLGMVRIRHSDGERFVLTMPEMAQEICDKLNQL